MIKPTPQMTPEFAMKMRYKAVDAIKSMTPNNPNRRGFIQILAEDERVKDVAGFRSEPLHRLPTHQWAR